MQELLQKLLESEILTEDTKADLETAFTTQLNEAIEEKKAEVEADVRADLTEQFIKDKEALVEALDTKAEEYLQGEIQELKEDIERFRDLEVEYAEKLVEAKEEMAKTVKNDIAQLVETLDAFLEMRLKAELEELQESIEDVRKVEFGRKLFEQFAEEFRVNFVDEESTQAALEESKQRLQDTESQLNEAEKKLSQVEREQKMNEVLEPLQGRSRELMEALLKSQPTDRLDEAYETFIPKVLHKSAEDSDEQKESESSPVLAESDESAKTEETKDEETIVVEGNSEDNSQLEDQRLDEGKSAELARLRQLAAIN